MSTPVIRGKRRATDVGPPMESTPIKRSLFSSLRSLRLSPITEKISKIYRHKSGSLRVRKKASRLTSHEQTADTSAMSNVVNGFSRFSLRDSLPPPGRTKMSGGFAHEDDCSRMHRSDNWLMESSSSTATSDGTGSGFGPLMEEGGMMYQNYRGQLKVSVYVNYGLLTVHVMQARHLAPKQKTYCDSFVKLSLVPDDSRRTKCKTEVIPDSNSPLFDEKFSFELLEEDMRKRLLISVWNKSTGRENANELLGCMSFGIKHVLPEKKTVNGWYYLLAEDVGRRKHLQAAVKASALRDRNGGSISKVNQDVLFMDPHTFLIRKGRGGYGFTVMGSCPVKVSRTEPGGPAELAGLRTDDYVIRVDGINVSRSTSDGVAKVIKNTGKKMMIEIQRSRGPMTNQQPSSLLPMMHSTPMVTNTGSNNQLHPALYPPQTQPMTFVRDDPVYMGPSASQKFTGLYPRFGSDQSVNRYGSDHSAPRCGSDQSNYKYYDLTERRSSGQSRTRADVAVTHSPSCQFHPAAGLLMSSPQKPSPPSHTTRGRMGVEIWIDDPQTLANAQAQSNTPIYGTLPRGKKVCFKDFA